MDTKRIFTSIDLPPAIKDAIKTLPNPEIRWIKWMKSGNLHITLNFLGDLNDEQIEQAKLAIAETASYYKPFSLDLAQIKGVRDMLWLEPLSQPKLFDLRDELTENLRKQKIRKRERRDYKPHILLAKSKTGRRMSWQPKELPPLEFEVDSINLYESQLKPEAADHILIGSFPLG